MRIPRGWEQLKFLALPKLRPICFWFLVLLPQSRSPYPAQAEISTERFGDARK